MMELLEAHWCMLTGWLDKHVSKRLLLACGISVFLTGLLNRFYRLHQTSSRLKQKKKQIKERMTAFRDQLKLLSISETEMLSLTELELSELRERIATGTLTPINLLHAFQLKALQLYEKGNSGICEFIQEAESVFVESAHDEPQTSVADMVSENRSPLYGIPISLKENFRVKGYDSTGGIIKLCNVPSDDDCVLVKVLRKTGAIPFVMTSTSQACRTIDGLNVIFGDVFNPFNLSRISGGSSSGEAVLLAQKGSPVGIGSDIGGSIRIPAGFCGLASLKPTLYRLSGCGMLNLAQHSVLSLCACPGPMGHRVDDLANVMRTLLTPVMFDMDYQVPPLPFNETLYNGLNGKRITVGYFDNLPHANFVQTVPVVREAVSHAVEAVTRAGHRAVKFTVPNPTKASHLFYRCIFADGGSELRKWLAYEPVGIQLRFLSIVLSLPNWVKCVSDFSVFLLGCRPLTVACTLGGLKNAQAAIDLMVAVREYRAEFQKAWNQVGPLDALICPVSAYPAPPSNAPTMFITPSIIYTALFNLVDYPAGTVPVAFVDRVDVMETTKVAVQRHLDGDWYNARVAVLQKSTEGLPVSVQVVGVPYREETVLRVMRIIENARSRAEQKN
ncbi:Fatty acid amide hydrolase [Paragonimus heterotremus]|uniref:Fatty acid amide hydrolase n=1 Tax=Paragonimus heterotremus TaxID=100268 RepID=A0A8J4SZQ3_9TREM|nr:Fatty acid amide hydrolase [Paragonimus heterotremus]